MQDIRAELIALLNGLTVTHNGADYTLSAGYEADLDDLKSPCVTVRRVHLQNEPGNIGRGVDLAEGRYDLSLVVYKSTAYDHSAFLKDAEAAIQTALRGVETSIGSAWIARITGASPDMLHRRGSTIEAERVLMLEARSVETY